MRPCKKADAETTANVLNEYFTNFIPVLQWFSYQGPHFWKKVSQTLASSFGVKHCFSAVYAPWSNGTFEFVCKEVLRVMDAFNSETNNSFSVPAIQSIINISPSCRLGGPSTNTVHTGMPSRNPLTVVLTDCNFQGVETIDQARILQKLNINKLLELLDKMHKDVDETLSASRKNSVERHNAWTHVVPYKPSVGDYVVVARTHGPRTKTSTNLVGPRRISRILSDFTVDIENLLTNSTAVVHVFRVKPYAEASIGTLAEMQEGAQFTDRM